LQGLQLGFAEIEKRHGSNMVSHLILLTDGQTYGDDEECVAFARMAGERNVGITSLGIGEDWNDVLLDRVAAQSGGVVAYISSPEQVQSLLRRRVLELGKAAAQRVKLEFKCVEGVLIESLYRALPSMERLPISSDPVELGSLNVDEPIVVVAEVGVSTMPPGEHRLMRLELTADVMEKEQRRERLRGEVSCTFLPEPPEEPAPRELLQVLSKVTIYRIQEQAWEALERGSVRDATSKLEIWGRRGWPGQRCWRPDAFHAASPPAPKGAKS